MRENEIARIVVDSALVVHKELGPGLLESVYERSMACELEDRGLRVCAQVPFPVEFKRKKLDVGFRADLVIEDLVILEIKSVGSVLPVHKKQLLTYLKITGLKLGLLINFNQVLLRGGITRIVHNL